jgi:hypothetical protein
MWTVPSKETTYLTVANTNMLLFWQCLSLQRRMHTENWKWRSWSCASWSLFLRFLSKYRIGAPQNTLAVEKNWRESGTGSENKVCIVWDVSLTSLTICPDSWNCCAGGWVHPKLSHVRDAAQDFTERTVVGEVRVGKSLRNVHRYWIWKVVT